MTTTRPPRGSRRFSFLSFSSLGMLESNAGTVSAASGVTHETTIFPRLRASLTAARRRVRPGNSSAGSSVNGHPNGSANSNATHISINTSTKSGSGGNTEYPTNSDTADTAPAAPTRASLDVPRPHRVEEKRRASVDGSPSRSAFPASHSGAPPPDMKLKVNNDSRRPPVTAITKPPVRRRGGSAIPVPVPVHSSRVGQPRSTSQPHTSQPTTLQTNTSQPQSYSRSYSQYHPSRPEPRSQSQSPTPYSQKQQQRSPEPQPKPQPPADTEFDAWIAEQRAMAVRSKKGRPGLPDFVDFATLKEFSRNGGGEMETPMPCTGEVRNDGDGSGMWWGMCETPGPHWCTWGPQAPRFVPGQIQRDIDGRPVVHLGGEWTPAGSEAERRFFAGRQHYRDMDPSFWEGSGLSVERKPDEDKICPAHINSCHLHDMPGGVEIHHAFLDEPLRAHHEVKECWRLNPMVVDPGPGSSSAAGKFRYQDEGNDNYKMTDQQGNKDQSAGDVDTEDDKENRRSWQEDLAHGVIEYWQRTSMVSATDVAANGSADTDNTESDTEPKPNSPSVVERWAAANGDNYPVALCPDQHPTCHLHRSSHGIELHHAPLDHAEYEREQRHKKTADKCWSRNRAILDRTHKTKAARVDKAWKDTWGTQPKWIEGKQFSELYGNGQVSEFGSRTTDTPVFGSNGRHQSMGPAGHRQQTQAQSLDGRKPARQGAPPLPGQREPATPARAKKSSTPPGRTPFMLAPSTIKVSAGAALESLAPSSAKAKARGSAYVPTPSRFKNKRYSAPPDPVTDRPPTPPPKNIATPGTDESNDSLPTIRTRYQSPSASAFRTPSPPKAEVTATSQSSPADPNGTIRGYLGLDAAELASAVARAEDMITSAGKSPNLNQASKGSHLLDNVSSTASSSPWEDEVIHTQSVEFLSSHVVLSTPDDSDIELTLNLRGTKYVLPALSVSGFRVTTEVAYWEMIRGARLVDIIGDVHNLVALGKRLKGVDTIRLVLRGHNVPWSLHIRAQNLITFTHVPWSLTKRKLDADDYYHGTEEARCIVEVGPVPNGIRRLVLHVVYDDRAPGMAIARFARLRAPASCRQVVIIFQRERQPGLSITLPTIPLPGRNKWLRTALAESLVEMLRTNIAANMNIAFTLVGVEMLAGMSCSDVLNALYALMGTFTEDRDRIRVLSHAEHAELVGVQVYGLETSPQVWPKV